MTERTRRILRGVGAVLVATGVVLFVLGLRGVLTPRPGVEIALPYRAAADQARLETAQQGSILLAVGVLTFGVGVVPRVQFRRAATSART